MKPYQVWWKRQDDWKKVYESDSPSDCRDYAKNNITHGGITQRIELRDAFGNETLETIYAKEWGL